MAGHLKRQLVQTARALARARETLAEIKSYVQSEKFHEWPYVNVDDIVARCVNATSEIDFAETRCATCDLAEATDKHICPDCAAGIEYGRNVRAATDQAA